MQILNEKTKQYLLITINTQLSKLDINKEYNRLVEQYTNLGYKQY